MASGCLLFSFSVVVDKSLDMLWSKVGVSKETLYLVEVDFGLKNEDEAVLFPVSVDVRYCEEPGCTEREFGGGGGG